MIYIIRHGQTEKNKAKLLQGRSDLPLNDAGIREAEAVRDRFLGAGIRFDRVYTSPLIRAVRTAEIIAGDASPVIDERLIEMDYGPYEGLDLRDWSQVPEEVRHFFSDFVRHPAPAGMEPLDEVVRRLGVFLEEIRETAAEENVLISTHAIAMKGALEYLTPGSSGSYWSKYIGNCAVYRAAVTGNGYDQPEEWEGTDE